MFAAPMLVAPPFVSRIAEGSATGAGHRDQVLIVNLFLAIGQVGKAGYRGRRGGGSALGALVKLLLIFEA
jgi:hypothetical protein